MFAKDLIEASPTVDRAFQAFRRAVEEGLTADFLQLASDDLRFAVPMPFPDWKGEQTGKERFEELIRFARQEAKVHIRLKPHVIEDAGPYGIAVFSVVGVIKSAPYTGEFVVVFEFEDDKVKAFRGYAGDPILT